MPETDAEKATRFKGLLVTETARLRALLMETQAQNANLHLALAALVAEEWSGLADEVDDDSVFLEAGAAGLIGSTQDPSGEYTTHLTEKGRRAILAALTSGAKNDRPHGHDQNSEGVSR
jgi:hypothetical protein